MYSRGDILMWFNNSIRHRNDAINTHPFGVDIVIAPSFEKEEFILEELAGGEIENSLFHLELNSCQNNDLSYFRIVLHWEG